MSTLMTLRIALKALNRNKLRSILTMLGMVIGVGAVVTTVALGTGARATVEDQIRGAGTNMITVFPGSATPGGVSQGAGANTRLVPEDAAALRQLPEIQYVTEGLQSRQQLIAGNQNWSTNVVGVNVEFTNVKSWPMKYGQFFSELDVQSTAKVCTLGLNVAQMLYGDDVDPTGETIRIKNQPFKVLGVMSVKGASSSGQIQDDQVFAPYTTVMKKLAGQQNLQYIITSAKSFDEMPVANEAVKALMRLRHKLNPGDDDDFRTQTADDLIAVRTGTTGTLTVLLMCVAAVSLLVGGVGIMNIMLVSVTERTREIGLRMAIGARGRDVLLQFLLEAIIISLLGGGLGIAAGYGASAFVRWYNEWPAIVPPDAIAMAVGFAGAVGVFFGFYPARKAASLDPIDALRFE